MVLSKLFLSAESVLKSLLGSQLVPILLFKFKFFNFKKGPSPSGSSGHGLLSSYSTKSIRLPNASYKTKSSPPFDKFRENSPSASNPYLVLKTSKSLAKKIDLLPSIS